MATVSLRNQLLYTPPVTSGAPSHLPPLLDAHDHRRGCPGNSLENALFISDGDSDCDDSSDGRSDSTLLTLEKLPTARRNGVQSNSVSGTTDKDINIPPGASGVGDAKGPSVDGGASADDSRPDCGGSPCRQGLGCPRHPNLSTKIYRRYRQAREPWAEAGNPFCSSQALPGGSSETGETEQLLGGHDLPQEGECSADTGDDMDYLTSARSGGREGTLCRDEGDKPELASAKPALQPLNSQDVVAHCNTSPEEDRGPAHPPVPDDRGELEKGGPVVPPPAQKTRASIPRLSDNEPSMQLSTSQNQVNLRRHISRRLQCNTDDGQNDYPMVGSDAEHSEKDDVAQPLPRKRRRVSTMSLATGGTASQQQTRPYCGDSSSKEAR
ncbi:hypothetical protein C8A00DRAFT_19234, partial [Chaetomidium leptoderma]